MKNVILCLLTITALSVRGQGVLNRSDSRVNSAHIGPISLFKQAVSQRQRPDLPEVSSYDLLESDPRLVELLLEEKPKMFSMAFPGSDGQPVNLELERVNLLTDDYLLQTSAGEATLETNSSVFYRGTIKGDPNSIAAVSVFPEGVQVMFNSPTLGNHHISRLPNSQETSLYMLYADRHLRNPKSFECLTEDSGRGYTAQELTPQINLRATTPCVRVYLEVDYDVFFSKGSLTATENYIKGLFNEVVTLYQRDGITLTLSQMFVWTTNNSPYPNSDIYTILRTFQGYRTSMNGDVGQLLTYKGSGGIAVVDGLCRTNVSSRVGVSSIDNYYTQVPSYSFSVMVVAHEIGHILGSQHTHACAWNGNNTAIDGCAGATEGTCGLPGIPTGGGTIMSYCHLTSAGINMLNGFGPQPSTLIRNRIAAAACLQACTPTGPGSGSDTTKCDSIILTLTLDAFGSETSWQILNAQNNQIVTQGGPYTNKQSGKTSTLPVCLPSGCYILKVKDSDGDGMCCAHGNGSFRLARKSGEVIAAGGQFAQEYTSTQFCVDTTTTPPPPPPPTGTCTIVDFTKTAPRTYGGSQDAGQVTVVDSRTITIQNNAWKMVPLEYDIKSTTMLAFDFKSTSAGEVHGIGFDNDLFVSAQLTFQVYGTQAWGLQPFRNYEGTGAWKSYSIPVGKYYTGKAKYLFFAMDDDISPALGNAHFRNVRVYESTTGDCSLLEEEPKGLFPTPTKLTVFPNPASDMIQVRAEGIQDGNASLSVYNTLGQEVQQVPVSVSGGFLQMSLPVQQLKNGSYTMRLRSGSQSLIQNFVIQQ